ncbi:MAG: glycoside hydrolase family 3 N-terminal domain-containing protein [Chloroflexota bacterium]
MRPAVTSATVPSAAYQEEAQALFDSLSSTERIGQLFLVTFQGDTALPESEIARLIVDYHVGGVVLLAKNNNITGYGDVAAVPAQVIDINNSLQQLALHGRSHRIAHERLGEADFDIPPTPTPSPPGTSIPLLIATKHEGDGHPSTQIMHGLTEIPNNLAIGATWQPQNARIVGEIVGQELAALGINMLLGPSLDVLEKPAPGTPSSLAIRAFGGDPYWVGQMGRAYTAGVHTGSNGRLAVIAKHFPGNGGSDRLINEEVPTVRKSLEQLKQIELAPFFAVTGQAEAADEVVDGLLSTHIRYQGFQGNIRATTAPVSFDPQALTSLMQLAEFSQWRQDGGLLVSDSLGARAVARFYDDTEQEFPHRRIAKDAFLAGNDLLFMDEFALSGSSYETELANIRDTIDWFEERYETDPTFQQRVDTAVLQILQLKLRLYDGDFSPENVLADTNALSLLQQNRPALFDVAQTAITLISPSQAELGERMASPPAAGDNIVIFTDVRLAQQCNRCSPEPLIAVNELEERILALYGPSASGQVQPRQITSYSFADLAEFLAAGSDPIVWPPLDPTPPPPGDDSVEDGEEAVESETADSSPALVEPTPTPPPPTAFFVQKSLAEADWIIFATLDKTSSSQPLSQFLAQRTDLLRNSKSIVFAYHAPYYLDTTEISKLTAYYGIYSKADAFIDASVRALFQELPLAGAAPVDVDGIGYNLFRQTQPDPQQVIELYITGSEGERQSPPREQPLDVSVGDTLRLQTGVIRDRNGHPVPNGTIVQFIQRDRIQGLVSIIEEVSTRQGIAQLDYVLEARTGPGQFRITAVAGEATQSQEVDIFIEGAAQVAILTPEPTPTPTPTPTAVPPTPLPTPQPTATPTIPPPQEEVGPPPEPGINILLSDFWMLLSLLGGLTMTFTVGLFFTRTRPVPLAQQLSWLLWGIVGGLLLYNYYLLGLPGTAVLLDLGSWAGLLTTLLGGLLGLSVFGARQFLEQK